MKSCHGQFSTGTWKISRHLKNMTGCTIFWNRRNRQLLGARGEADVIFRLAAQSASKLIVEAGANHRNNVNGTQMVLEAAAGNVTRLYRVHFRGIGKEHHLPSTKTRSVLGPTTKAVELRGVEGPD